MTMTIKQIFKKKLYKKIIKNYNLLKNFKYIFRMRMVFFTHNEKFLHVGMGSC